MCCPAFRAFAIAVLCAGAPRPAIGGTAWTDSWLSTVRLSGDIEAGLTVAPLQGDRSPILGQVTTDRNAEPLLNQVLLAVARPLDDDAHEPSLGFRVSALFGSDARYTRLTGQFPNAVTGRTAFDIADAYLQWRLPGPGGSSLDLRLGEYLSPLGYEVLSAPDDVFYSHSYIFNFGVPIKHAGGFATWHLSRQLDLIAGADRGANTSFEADNNKSLSFLLGATFQSDRLTISALTHAGPENPENLRALGPDRNFRFYNDVVVAWHPAPHVTSVTEIAYVRDDGLRAEAGGASQYLIYNLTPSLSLAGRLEVWRDPEGAFVDAFPDPNDQIDSETGRPNHAIAAGPATYAALTVGATVETAVAMIPIILRPECRFDRALAGHPFDGGRSREQLTLALDLAIPFGPNR